MHNTKPNCQRAMRSLKEKHNQTKFAPITFKLFKNFNMEFLILASSTSIKKLENILLSAGNIKYKPKRVTNYKKSFFQKTLKFV
jgi:hypothetical protein